jgi:hypothetical protein
MPVIKPMPKHSVLHSPAISVRRRSYSSISSGM